ncbi:MAG: hypothetical protein KDB23_19845, partial [Planctomycetales bacterium]|nr:hypothetical protein [Planctomycetales bacterium]
DNPAEQVAPATPVETDSTGDMDDLIGSDAELPVPTTPHAAPPSSQPPPRDTLVAPQSPNEEILIDTPPGRQRADVDVSPEEDRSDSTSDAPSSGANASCEPDPHAELFIKEMYPSAKACATCHEQIYREWSVSSHAYAAVSPMFIRFEQTINDLARGTIGYFCMRCHAPVAVETATPRDTNPLEMPAVFREGVTCIACHRVVERYGRANGERRIETGSIFEPIVGTGHGGALQKVIDKKDYYKVKTSPQEKGPGQDIHNGVVQFDHIGTSNFCVSCHQVAVYPGIKLEVVWEQYRASPACKSGIRCQDCHMGAVPGQPAGFDTAPVAVINNKRIGENRRHSNHMFAGPGYSIAHPGVFPFHDKADRWTPEEWLEFDWRAGWGTEKFEEQLEDGKIKATFPPAWQNVDDRYDAREIIEENQELIAEKTQQRVMLMEGSSKLQGPYFKHPPRVYEPLKFRYELTNLNSGHNLPTGSLGAQPQLWVNVVLTGPGNEWLWESGYVDANGDMADLHSLEVAAGWIPRDQQLVNLQTKFLITNVKGTDREMYLPINIDFDQLPFIRPNGFPVTTMNHPPFIRMEAHSVPPLGRRLAHYVVPADRMCKPGRYRLSVRMRSRAEPIYFMRFCGSTPEMERAMNENMLDFHQHAFEFTVR